MAITKLWPVKGNVGSTGFIVKKLVEYDTNDEKTTSSQKEREDEERAFLPNQITNVIEYTSREDKVGEKQFITTINCTEDYCISEMCVTKRRFGERGNRIMWHGVQSFKPNEITPEKSHEMGVSLAEELWGDRFEVVVTTHLDREHIHNHFAINSVSFIDGKKFDWDTEIKKMRQVSDRLCRENALSVIEADEYSGHYHRGAIRAEEEGRYTLLQITKEDIDACIRCSRNMDEWFSLMQNKGYTINTERKYLRVYPYGHERPIRIDRRFSEKYNEDYTLEGIRAKIAENIASGGYIDPNALEDLSKYDDIGYIIDKIRTDGSIDGRYSSDNSNSSTNSNSSANGNKNAALDSIYPRKPFKEYGYKMPKRVAGVQKTYNRYLILLGVHPARRPRQIARTHYLLREDLLKLDKYIAENNLLISRDIRDISRLKDTRDMESDSLSQMYKDRNKLRNQIRRCSSNDLDTLRDKLAEMNDSIRKQKRIVFYCNDILRSLPEMEEKMAKAASLTNDNKKENIKKIKENQTGREL